ncbi:MULTISPECIES: hypothetical protein [unclassified Frankia]
MAHDLMPVPSGLVDLCEVDADQLAFLAGPPSGEWQRWIAAWIGHPGGPLPEDVALALGGDLDLADYLPRTTSFGEMPDGTDPSKPPRPPGAAACPGGRPAPGSAMTSASRRPARPTGPARRVVSPPAARHRITPRDIEAVAGGPPGAAPLRELLRGQISKRMLMLWALLRGLENADLDDATRTCVDEALRVLGDAQRRARDAVHDLLLHPTIGTWLAGSLRRCWHGSAGPDLDRLGYVGGIAVAAALRARMPCRVPVRIIDGLVSIPTVGVVGSGVTSGWGVAHVSDRRVTLSGSPGRGPAGGDGWTPARTLSSTVDGHRIALTLEDTDPFRAADTLPLAVATRCDEAAAGPGGSACSTAPGACSRATTGRGRRRPPRSCRRWSRCARSRIGPAPASP